VVISYLEYVAILDYIVKTPRKTIVKTPRKTIVKTPRKTNTFTKKQNNVQAFVSLHIRPIVLFCRKYFLQEVFVRFYFLVKITAGKASIN